MAKQKSSGWLDKYTAAVRYDEALSDEAKKAFGIKGPHDLSKVKNAYIGALDVLSKGARYTDNNVAGHPGLEDKDRMERALYWYNNPSNVVNSDAETFQAISKKANNLFPWQDKQELMSKAYNSPLEMSPGSYPDKVLRQSKGLHQVIDFNDMNVLPEVRVVAPKEEIVETTGGQFAMGGSMPGAVGFTYARTINPAPSNGPYAKKTKASAKNGTEMKFYQEGLDWTPKTISKNGSVIKDDMGQWNHPGEITEIGSNQITMQGVPYPVLGISDTGDMQMMYPNEEYQYDGSSVTEYPMAQDGMQVVPGQDEELQEDPWENSNWLNSIDFLNLGTNNPIKEPIVEDANHFIPGMADKFDIMRSAFDNKNTEFYTNWDKQNKIDISKAKNIKLNTGRFRGAKVPNTIIDDLAKTSREQNVSLGQLLTLMGRESTFGSGTEKNKNRMTSKERLMSGWNVAEQYMPYLPERFLADNKVPGVKATATPHGYSYELTNESKMNDYLRKNPKLLKQYQQKLDSAKALGNQDAFDLAAQFLKKKGIQAYNPGDPGYVNDFNKDYNLLKQDKGLMNYINQKGYKFEEGGSLQLTKLDQLTNFTNYNTKQPGGWLDKYSD